MRYTLTVKELELIELSSSGNAHARSLLVDRLEIRVTSAGDLRVDELEANVLEVVISSAGHVRIDDGVVDRQNLRISSAGNYHGGSLRSAHATVRLSSVGVARLWAEESLDATLSSVGSVYYRGNPEIVDSHSSTGRVRPIR